MVTIPTAGKVPTINVSEPSASSFPARQLTEIGGEWPYWEANGKKVHWSLGNGHWVYDLSKAEFVEDSVKTAKKEKISMDADSVSTLIAGTLQQVSLKTYFIISLKTYSVSTLIAGTLRCCKTQRSH